MEKVTCPVSVNLVVYTVQDLRLGSVQDVDDGVDARSLSHWHSFTVRKLAQSPRLIGNFKGISLFLVLDFMCDNLE